MVGDDFSAKDEAILRRRAIDIEGLERTAGKCFFWAGRYSENLNERVTLATEASKACCARHHELLDRAHQL